MAELHTKNFHIIEKVKAKAGKLFVLAKWEPENTLQVVGAQLGLLCCVGSGWELNICVSRSPNLRAEEYEDFYVALRRDYLLYAQRDAYNKCSGIADMVDWQMLPAGEYFLVSKENPVYIKVGVNNFNSVALEYDAFVNLYFE